jgi:hypothetical protein
LHQSNNQHLFEINSMDLAEPFFISCWRKITNVAVSNGAQHTRNERPFTFPAHP